MSVYLDNAATTPLDPAVLDAMLPFLRDNYGNPSSIHAQGRTARSAIETSRKKIAGLLNTSSSNIYFTAGGTEGDNTVIRGFIDALEIGHVVSTRIEHHAVLHTLEYMETSGKCKISYLDLDHQGNIDYGQLESLLQNNRGSLVCLMHGNNEIGNLLDLERTGAICVEHDAWFHSDTVQTVGKYSFDLNRLAIDAAVGSAHKFHGPKGSGFLYLNPRNKIHPLIHGGGQEKEMRSGTENVAGIVGLAKAFEISCRDMEKNRSWIINLKDKMISLLKEQIPGIKFNGNVLDPGKSLYNIVSVSLPVQDDKNLVLFKLDLEQVSASGGSACASGALKGSHVINALGNADGTVTIRFSFSKFNTLKDVDIAVGTLKKILDQFSLTRE